ncbi:olfactory receptor 2AG2-like [Ochotona curzoniae]|uniref:olfactory receptor 2AG2-like n=1 Tax=Ochotona curzoniae TaxID=130825 RepID=UPI001B345F96|nr:olfactory receptor 2AG2-like [Ochotona curzoniae]
MGSEFILLGLFPHLQHADVLAGLIILTYALALGGNATLTVLILLDARLHTPMYFLLRHLSLVDLLFISTTVPRMAASFFSGHKRISHIACGTQTFFFLTLGGAECVLLMFMACDRYVAICHPLRYHTIMSQRVCQSMVLGSWVGSGLNALAQVVYTMYVPKCGFLQIEHFFCEPMAVMKLACGDTSTYQLVILVIGIVLLLIPFGVISSSYTIIFLTVLRMNSRQARKKALGTCSSHLLAVSLFYGPTIFTYMTPGSSHSPAQDQAVSVFFSIVTPMLNPFIYSLRNREVTQALRKALSLTTLSCHKCL